MFCIISIMTIFCYDKSIEYFFGHKGVRQGGINSAYLFTKLRTGVAKNFNPKGPKGTNVRHLSLGFLWFLV